MKKQAIIYTRISTNRNKQVHSLDQQRASAIAYCKKHNLEIREIIQDENSSTKNREKLNNAILLAKNSNSVLVIATISRLYRNLASLSALLEQKDLEFVAVDMAEFSNKNKYVLQSQMLMLEFELDMIQKRVKQGLATAKSKRSAKQSNIIKKKQAENLKKGRIIAYKNKSYHVANLAYQKQANEKKEQQLKLMQMYCKDLKTYTYLNIANCLNDNGIHTTRSKMWTAMAVKRVLDKFNMQANSLAEISKVA